MIRLTQIKSDGINAELCIKLENFTGCNTAPDKSVWVTYFDPDGNQFRKAKVLGTSEEVQSKLFVCRHGKLPAKGVLCA